MTGSQWCVWGIKSWWNITADLCAELHSQPLGKDTGRVCCWQTPEMSIPTAITGRERELQFTERQPGEDVWEEPFSSYHKINKYCHKIWLSHKACRNMPQMILEGGSEPEKRKGVVLSRITVALSDENNGWFADLDWLTSRRLALSSFLSRICRGSSVMPSSRS